MTADLARTTAMEMLDTGEFARKLGALVAYPTESQNPQRAEVLEAYLSDAIGPLYEAAGFTLQVFPNPVAGGGPLLVATRHEDNALPNVLSYGHGDVVLGMAGEWVDDRAPFEVSETNERFYGRGTADNKGQHLINLLALEAVLRARDGTLGFNLKILIEMSEETGSTGLREFAEANRALLAADVLIGSDGPRVSPETPTVCLGTRGAINFTLSLKLREEAHHSGNWGGFIADPAIILSHAIASICTREGRIMVREWRPDSLAPAMRAALDGCPFDAGDGPDGPDPDWGEPELSLWEKAALWPSFSVLAFEHGNPAKPVNAIQPMAQAHCGLRFPASVPMEGLLPALRRHLDEAGFEQVEISVPEGDMVFPATTGDPTSDWAQWAAASVERSLGKPAQILPSLGGSLPNDVFTQVLGMETLWLPHSYSSCGQHAPDEHLLKPLAREGLAMMAGIWWDLGEKNKETPE